MENEKMNNTTTVTEANEIINSAVEEKEDWALYRRIQAPSSERYHKIRSKAMRGLNIGWKMANNDELTELYFRGLTVIAARTAGGKTFTLTNIAAKALEQENIHVLFITLEEPEDSIFLRILGAHIANKESAAAAKIKDLSWQMDNDNGIFNSTYYDSLSIFAQRLRIADLHTIPNLDRVNIAVEIMQRFVDTYGARNSVICLDYIQLLRPEYKSGDWRDFKDVMSELKKIYASGTCLFAGAQLNREAARYTTEDSAKEFLGTRCEQLREAADIEQAAEMIIFCKYDDAERRMNYRILKNRRGARELMMSMRAYFSHGCVDWKSQDVPTLCEARRWSYFVHQPIASITCAQTKKRGRPRKETVSM